MKPFFTDTQLNGFHAEEPVYSNGSNLPDSSSGKPTFFSKRLAALRRPTAPPAQGVADDRGQRPLRRDPENDDDLIARVGVFTTPSPSDGKPLKDAAPLLVQKIEDFDPLTAGELLWEHDHIVTYHKDVAKDTERRAWERLKLRNAERARQNEACITLISELEAVCTSELKLLYRELKEGQRAVDKAHAGANEKVSRVGLYNASSPLESVSVLAQPIPLEVLADELNTPLPSDDKALLPKVATKWFLTTVIGGTLGFNLGLATDHFDVFTAFQSPGGILLVITFCALGIALATGMGYSVLLAFAYAIQAKYLRKPTSIWVPLLAVAVSIVLGVVAVDTNVNAVGLLKKGQLDAASGSGLVQLPVFSAYLLGFITVGGYLALWAYQGLYQGRWGACLNRLKAEQYRRFQADTEKLNGRKDIVEARQALSSVTQALRREAETKEHISKVEKYYEEEIKRVKSQLSNLEDKLPIEDQHLVEDRDFQWLGSFKEFKRRLVQVLTQIAASKAQPIGSMPPNPSSISNPRRGFWARLRDWLMGLFGRRARHATAPRIQYDSVD